MDTPREPATKMIKAVADELVAIRGRGPDRIDLTTHNQQPLKLERIERLADDYCDAAAHALPDRAGRIDRLLRDALAAYREAGNPAAAAFIFDLLFDPADQAVPQLPGTRLEAAMKAHADGKTFDQVRTPLLRTFATFLIRFVAETRAQPGADAPTKPAALPPSQSARQRPGRPNARTAVLAALALVLAAGLGVALWAATGDRERTVTGSDPTTPATDPAERSAQPAAADNETYTQVCGVRAGCPVFDNPHTPSRSHQKVAFMQNTDVRCKVHAPSMASVEWWYRLVSEPYDGEWYAPAVNFLNGDPVDGPYLNDVDDAVPDC